MNTEDFVRRYVFKILREQEEREEKESLPTTTGPGPGRYKKELANLKALSDANPKVLMKKLGIGPGVGNKQSAILIKMFGEAIAGAKEMGAVYTTASEKKDAFGRVAASIGLTGELPPRDALVFIREIFRGAKKAGYIPFKDDVQVEILGEKILAYSSSRPFRWNKKPKTKKPAEQKPKETKPDEQEQKPKE